MFERFTEQARRVVVLAQEEARILKHGYIGSEHILLGVLREEDGLAAGVLESRDITLERVRARVVELVGVGEGPLSGQIPFTPEGKKPLELALREGLSLRHNHIGPEHILLGLLRTDGSSRILEELSAAAETVRREVLRVMAEAGASPPGRAGVASTRIPYGLIDWAGEPLARLATEIGENLDRPADAGDLLVLLACVDDGVAARTLAELGVDPERLAAAAQEVRAAGVTPEREFDPALTALADAVRTEKEQAIDAQDYERAANLRDREQEQRRQARAVVETRFENDLLAQVRQHLGLPRN